MDIRQKYVERWTIFTDGVSLKITPLSLDLDITYLGSKLAASRLIAEWEKDRQLVDCFSQGGESLWWLAQRNAFAQDLALVLPLLECLFPLSRGGGPAPREIKVYGARKHLAPLKEVIHLCFPKTKIIESRWRKTLASFATGLARRWVHAARRFVALRRLRRIPSRKGRSRFLVLHSEEHRLAGCDKDTGALAAAARQAGLEVVEMGLAGLSLRKALRGLLQRPGSHLFSEIVRPGGRQPRWKDCLQMKPGQFTHKNIDLTTVVWRWMNLKPLADVAQLQRDWENLLSRIDPDVILLAYEHAYLGCICRAARAKKIKLCLLQHGRITEDHLLYVFPERARHRYEKPFRFFVYSGLEVEVLKNKSVFDGSELVAAGSPEWDPIWASTNRTPDKPRGIRLLFTSQPRVADKPILSALLQMLDLSPFPVHLRIRLHPYENARETKRLCAQLSPRKVEFSVDAGLHDDLSWCDLHATVSSTVLMHALIGKKPSIVLGEIGDSWRSGFVSAGVAFQAKSPNELAAAVSRLTEPGAFAEFS